MAAIKTVMTYPLNSSTVNFNIPFEYLARKFVTITLIGKDRRVLVLNQDYRFTTKTQITTTRSWGPGDGYTSIEVRRFTSATDRLVDFADGSILRAYDLNISQVQTLHVAEEARDLTADTIGVNNDGNLDARGRRIVNLADATLPGDAINLGQVQNMSNGAFQSAQNALAQAQEATRQQVEATRQAGIAGQQAQASSNSAGASKTSETNSKASENASNAARDLAKQWASAAQGVIVQSGLYSAYHWALGAAASAAEALGYRNQAAQHKADAATSATKATTEADRAKSEADKLGNNNLFVGAVESVNDTTLAVSMKGDFKVKNLTSVGSVTADTMNVQSAAAFNNGAVVRLRNADNSGEINFKYSGSSLQFNYSGPMRHFDFNNLGADRVGFINAYSDTILRAANDPSAPTGAYLNTPAFRTGFRSRGNMPGTTDFGHMALYAQEHVGDTFAGIIHVLGYGNSNAWYFKQNGEFVSPGSVRASDKVISAGEVWAAGGGARLAADGNVYGTLWGGWMRDWVNSNAMADAGRGGQQFRGGAISSAWECPAGCFLTGTNTNYADGRQLGSYFRQLIGRKISGGQFALGDF